MSGNNTTPGTSPETVAWRLSAVELEVKETRKEIKEVHGEVMKKLDGIASGFATHKDIEVAKHQAKMEHDAIYERIGDLEREIASLKRRNWVQNTMSAILGATLAILIAYFLNGVIQ